MTPGAVDSGAIINTNTWVQREKVCQCLCPVLNKKIGKDFGTPGTHFSMDGSWTHLFLVGLLEEVFS